LLYVCIDLLGTLLNWHIHLIWFGHSCRVWLNSLRYYLFHVYIFMTWWCLWSVIPLTLKLIFLHILYIQSRKIIFINHWLNLHHNEEALLLPLRFLISCHRTLLNFNMTKYSSRLHLKKYLLTTVVYSFDEFLVFWKC
jgi:hypothetical protein